MHLRVMPHIRLPRKPPTLEMELRGEVRPEWYQPPRVLHELAFEMDIGPEEFLVIGPSPAIKNPHLAGALLLCEEVAGRKTESLYFITPRVVKADGGGLP